MAPSVSEFHITSHLLFQASGRGATNSLLHVLSMGVSYSRLCAYRTLNSTQSIHTSHIFRSNDEPEIRSGTYMGVEI